VQLKHLRAAGHVLVYPAHQFAIQALMGISSRQTLDLSEPNLSGAYCGKEFMDLLDEEPWQPSFDSLTLFFKNTAFALIRNISAHDTDGVYAVKNTSLLNAAR
jgi:hypothetical protein